MSLVVFIYPQINNNSLLHKNKTIKDNIKNKLELCQAPVWLGVEVGEIFKFPVWIIPFPVFKSSFKLVDKIYKHFVKEVF